MRKKKFEKKIPIGVYIYFVTDEMSGHVIWKCGGVGFHDQGFIIILPLAEGQFRDV